MRNFNLLTAAEDIAGICVLALIVYVTLSF